MKRILLIWLFLCFCLQNGYSQSFNYEKYYKQVEQKVNNLEKELQYYTQSAMQASNKDIYVLYLNGNNIASFKSESECRTQINKIKSVFNSFSEDALRNASDLPASVRNQARSIMEEHTNKLNFTYNKERNPNYKPTTSTSEETMENDTPPEKPPTPRDIPETKPPTAKEIYDNASGKKQEPIASKTDLLPPKSIDNTDSKNTDNTTQKNGDSRFIGVSKGGPTSVYIDNYNVTVNPEREGPSLSEIDFRNDMQNSRRQDELNREMEQLAKEIRQMERFASEFCPSLYSDCEYQKRKEELLTRLDEKITELKSLKKDEYDARVNKYEQTKAKYEQELSKCKNKPFFEICERDMRRAIDETEKSIAEVKTRLNTENKLVDNYLKNYSEPKMSEAKRQCEIAYEMKKRGDNVAGTIILSANAPIVAKEKAAQFFKDGMKDEYVRKTTVDATVDGTNFAISAVSLSLNTPDNGTLIKDVLKEGAKSLTSDLIKEVAGTGNTGNLAKNTLTSVALNAGEKIPVIGKIFQVTNTVIDGINFSKSSYTAGKAWLNFANPNPYPNEEY